MCDAELAQAVELAEHLLGVVDEEIFGDFELEPLRRKSRLLQHVGDRLGDVAVAELRRRQIDRDEQAARAI